LPRTEHRLEEEQVKDNLALGITQTLFVRKEGKSRERRGKSGGISEGSKDAIATDALKGEGAYSFCRGGDRGKMPTFLGEEGRAVVKAFTWGERGIHTIIQKFERRKRVQFYCESSEKMTVCPDGG